MDKLEISVGKVDETLENLDSRLMELDELINNVKTEKSIVDDKILIHKSIIHGYFTALHDLGILNISQFCEYCDRLNELMDKYWNKRISNTIKIHNSKVA